MNDHDLLLAIQELMDCVEWTPDTLDAIARLMVASGYRIRDLDDRDLEEAADDEAILPDGSRCPWDERLRTVGATRVRRDVASY